MTNSDERALLAAKINAETARIAWTGVQRFFAQGRAIFVHPSADLIDVAVIISLDLRDELLGLMNESLVMTVSDAQAREWIEADAMMWSVVVKPWVLVQPLLTDRAKDVGAVKIT